MAIQWFPGHMQNTEEFLKKAVSRVDVVMEILDARLPISSSNPLLDTMCKQVLRIKVLNKQDLADPEATRSWLEHFKTEKTAKALAITGTDKKETWKAADFCIKNVNKGKARRTRVIVVGIPNTGKSTIINTLAGKKIAKTGNVPAITRQQQRTGLKNKIDIYDTPGILWPVLDDKDGAYRLAVSGAISDAAIDYYDIGCFAARFLMKNYPEQLKKRYKIDTSFPESGSVLLEIIGAKRGCLKKGGIIDYQKASEILIRDLRSGKIGRISFEAPGLIKPIEMEKK